MYADKVGHTYIELYMKTLDLFLTNTKLFTLQDINWWTGVLRCF